MVMRSGDPVSLTDVSERINAAVNRLPVAKARRDEFVFLSHAEVDARDVEQLARLLNLCGFSAWWSSRIRAGQKFRAEIADRLNTAMVVVVLWTPASVHSEWVISEATRAHKRSALVPVIAPGIEIDDIPPPFDTLHTLQRDDVEGLVGSLREARNAQTSRNTAS